MEPYHRTAWTCERHLIVTGENLIWNHHRKAWILKDTSLSLGNSRMEPPSHSMDFWKDTSLSLDNLILEPWQSMDSDDYHEHTGFETELLCLIFQKLRQGNYGLFKRGRCSNIKELLYCLLRACVRVPRTAHFVIRINAILCITSGKWQFIVC